MVCFLKAIILIRSLLFALGQYHIHLDFLGVCLILARGCIRCRKCEALFMVNKTGAPGLLKILTLGDPHRAFSHIAVPVIQD